MTVSDEYIRNLQNRIKTNSKDYDAVELYAIALSDIGENEEALKNFMFLKSVLPDNARVYYNIGIILEKLKMPDDSIIAYEKALSLDSANTDIMFNLANSYIKTNEFDKAEKLLLKVIETDNNDENAYFQLGEVYSRQKKHQLAIEYLNKALEIEPNDYIAKFYLAYEYKEDGNTNKAIQIYNEIISHNPDYSWAYYNLASIYIEQGAEDKAIMYLEKTIKTNPKDLKAVKLIVKLFVKYKKYAAAEKILRQTSQEFPDEADIFYLLAQIHKLLKNKLNYSKYLKLTLAKADTFTGNIDELNSEIKAAEIKQK